MSYKVLNHINFALLVIVASFPILSFELRSISTTLLLVLSIFFYFKSREYYIRPWKILLLYSLPMLVLAFSLIYSEQIGEGAKDLIQLLSFLVFPLAFVLNPITQNKVIKLKIVFIASILILILYQIIMIGVNFETIFGEPSSYELKINGISEEANATAKEIQKIKTRRFRNYILEITNTHPTYQSIWIIFAVGLSFSLWKKIKLQWLKTVFVINTILLLIFLVMLSSRMPLIAGGIAALAIMVKQSFKTKVLVTLSLISLGFLVYILVPSISIRIDEVLTASKSLIQKESDVRDFNSTNVRLGIYSCSQELFISKPIFGYGVGNVQPPLTNCLVNQVNSKIYNWRSYNTHNQYLYFLLATGVVGFVVLIFWVWKLFQWAYIYQLQLFKFFYIFILICFLTENILTRNDGVLFFGFFAGLLLFNSISLFKHK